MSDKNIMDAEYFDDVLAMFYEAKNKNEELYENMYSQYKNSQNVGFTMGTSRNASELGKVLASLRSNAISAASQLMSAKKTVVELELKKRQQEIEKDKNDDGKDWIRATLNAIQLDNLKAGQKKLEEIQLGTVPIVRNVTPSKKVDKSQLDKIIDEKLNSGEISFTKNEKAMKYDFNDDAEPIYDTISNSIKVVKKGTSEEIKEYPLERVRVGKLIDKDEEKQIAYFENGKTLRIGEVK